MPQDAAASTPFRAYLKTLVAYFMIQLFTNLAVFCSFTAWRLLVKNYRVPD